MTKPHAYICGPMRGHYLFNFPAFFIVAQWASMRDWETINPAQMDIDAGFRPEDPSTYPKDMSAFVRDALKRDLIALSRCSVIFLMRGWEASEGAWIELTYALSLGIIPLVIEYDRDGYPCESHILKEPEYVKAWNLHRARAVSKVRQYGQSRTLLGRVRKVLQYGVRALRVFGRSFAVLPWVILSTFGGTIE